MIHLGACECKAGRHSANANWIYLCRYILLEHLTTPCQPVVNRRVPETMFLFKIRECSDNHEDIVLPFVHPAQCANPEADDALNILKAACGAQREIFSVPYAAFAPLGLDGGAHRHKR